MAGHQQRAARNLRKNGIQGNSFFSNDNSGKTWKHVHAGGLVGNLAESNGVLVAISMRRIIRSTDNGENWTVVIGEGVENKVFNLSVSGNVIYAIPTKGGC